MSAQPPQLPEPGAGLPPHDLPDLAGFGQRLIARMIDTIVAVVLPALLFVSSRNEGSGWLVAFYTAAFGIFFLNDVVLTTMTGGTVGKLLAGTRVVTLFDRRPVTAPTAVRRWVALVVLSFIPIAGLLDDFWIFTGQLRQTLHDRFAETIVVRSRAA